MTGTAEAPPRSRGQRVLLRVERIGNRIPDPFILVLLLIGVVAVLSTVLDLAGAGVTDPRDGSDVAARSLLSADGIRTALTGAVDNVVDFPPLGPVLVAVIGIGFADKAGLMLCVLRRLVARVPISWITFVIAVSGAVANLGGDAVNVFMFPAGAILYRAIGRSPVLGVAVAFAANSGTLGASPVVTTSDIIQARLTTEAAQAIVPGHVVTPLANYFFSAASALLVAVVITVVVEKVLVRWYPLGPEDAEGGDQERSALDPLRAEERRGMRRAGAAALVLVALVVGGHLVPGSPLVNPGGPWLEAPVLEGFAVVVCVFFLVTGLVYGVTTGVIGKAADVPVMITSALREFAPLLTIYVVLAQFVAYLKYTRINDLAAMGGAGLLESSGVPPWALLLALVAGVSLLNLVITSSSAQWTVLSPVLVPMLMLVDIPPEITQAAYRIADSCTGIITPVGSSFVLALSVVRMHRPNAGIGTLISVTLPLCLAMIASWTVLFFLWLGFGVPLGIGVPTDGFSLGG